MKTSLIAIFLAFIFLNVTLCKQNPAPKIRASHAVKKSQQSQQVQQGQQSK
jgi:hypothetical protein